MRELWYWWYTNESARGFENCRKQLSLLNPELNEAGIDYTYEMFPDERGGFEIHMHEDGDEPGEGISDMPDDWTIHALELAEGWSLRRPGDPRYELPADVLSTAGNQADVENPAEVADSEGREGCGNHVPEVAAATVISDD